MEFPKTVQSLKAGLSEWSDFDEAAYHLAHCLGLMPLQSTFGAAKHVFWSANPVGDLLYTTLNELARIGVLELDDDEQKLRWNAEFIGSWEKPIRERY